MAMLWPVLLVIGGYVAWHRWGAEHVSQKYYGLDVGMIHVTQRTSARTSRPRFIAIPSSINCH